MYRLSPEQTGFEGPVERCPGRYAAGAGFERWIRLSNKTPGVLPQHTGYFPSRLINLKCHSGGDLSKLDFRVVLADRGNAVGFLCFVRSVAYHPPNSLGCIRYADSLSNLLGGLLNYVEDVGRKLSQQSSGTIPTDPRRMFQTHTLPADPQTPFQHW